MQYSIYRNNVNFENIENLINKNINSTTPLITINKNNLKNISNFLSIVKINATYNNGFKINEIVLLGGKIKSSINNKINNIMQQFNIKSSYVATIDKNIVNGVSIFYTKIEDIVKREEPIVVFDVSKEDNLQRILSENNSIENTVVTNNTLVASANQPQTSSINNENITQNSLDPFATMNVNNTQNINNNTQVNPTTKKNDNKALKTIGLILLGIILTLLLVWASISIGVKIMNMS